MNGLDLRGFNTDAGNVSHIVSFPSKSELIVLEYTSHPTIINKTLIKSLEVKFDDVYGPSVIIYFHHDPLKPPVTLALHAEAAQEFYQKYLKDVFEKKYDRDGY